MTREQFDRLVRQVEAKFNGRPAALRWRVALWAGAGYFGFIGWLGSVLLLAALFLVPAFYLGSDGVILWIFGALILLGGGWTAVRALWVKIPPPKGRQISKFEAPALFAMIDELRSKLRAGRFHQVILTSEYNASVRQSPRLGVLGWWRNYLMLGLPLLETIPEEELRAVLAHELAHLSREHGRFGHWLYRLRAAWDRVFATLRGPQIKGEVTVRSFLAKYVEWFWPHFNAHAFVFSRSNEYEADAAAAELAGRAQMANALARIAVNSRVVDEKFWPDLWQRTNCEAEPPSDVLKELRDRLGSPLPDSERVRLGTEALRVVTTNADTHPCLRDRLELLNTGSASSEALLMPMPPAISAAEKLFGPALDNFRRDLEEQWRIESLTNWHDHHAKATALKDRLQNLSQAVPDPAINVDALWDKARMVVQLENDRAAEPLLRNILQLQPGHAAANFCLGRHLLDMSDASGEAHLEKAMLEDEQLVPQACDLLFAFFRRLGLAERIREIQTRLDRYEESLAASRSERSTISPSDTLIPHELSNADLAELRRVLSTEPEIASAQLGRKELRFFPNQRLFLLCVRMHPRWHRLPDRNRDQAVVARLSQSVKLPGRILVFAPTGSFRAIARKLAKVPGARIVPSSTPTGEMLNSAALHSQGTEMVESGGSALH